MSCPGLERGVGRRRSGGAGRRVEGECPRTEQMRGSADVRSRGGAYGRCDSSDHDQAADIHAGDSVRVGGLARTAVPRPRRRHRRCRGCRATRRRWRVDADAGVHQRKGGRRLPAGRGGGRRAQRGRLGCPARAGPPPGRELRKRQRPLLRAVTVTRRTIRYDVAAGAIAYLTAHSIRVAVPDRGRLRSRRVASTQRLRAQFRLDRG